VKHFQSPIMEMYDEICLFISLLKQLNIEMRYTNSFLCVFFVGKATGTSA